MTVPGFERITELMENLSETAPEEAVRIIDEALCAAAEGTPPESLAADTAAVRLLSDRRAGGPIIEQASLALFEALGDRWQVRLRASPDDTVPPDLRRGAWDLLDLLRHNSLLRRIAESGTTEQWADRILALVESSHYTFGQLFTRRCSSYGTRTLFHLTTAGGERRLSWRQVSGRVELAARGLLHLLAEIGEAPVAILSENRMEMVTFDLACLTCGVVNVMIPATATDSDVAFILGHAGVGAVAVSDRRQLNKVLKAREDLPGLKAIIALDPDASAAHREAIPFETLMERAIHVDPAQLTERRDRMRIEDRATIMYTSGTTGTPKGIEFSQRNIVFKRFARALALPEIGEGDRFLCYLPLFHTFGRFLEMTGCIFWGATYCFARNPSIETLTRQMRELKPTVFISIPARWIQIHERISGKVDLESAGDEEILTATEEVTGGALRWGLSAAGYLDPEIFRFFQRQGIELMSGFGMTEATGGITMTPPGQYRDNSLGRALPGIEISLAEDGELLIRGPYVMTGYLDPPDGEPSFDEKGWLHTGDLMVMDEDGFIRLVDRKKEIYKNVKGQTIAPQKVENLFRDFESVGRIFLVGDHRPFNTALIYPNPDFKELDLSALTPDERMSHFRSLVVSANSFLAPFERIVDFAVIDRDFDQEQNELTAKGTFRRRIIEDHFADTIRLLYRQSRLEADGVEVTVPNWLFQTLGITTRDLVAEPGRIHSPAFNTSLTVRKVAEDEVQIGSAIYRTGKQGVGLGTLLSVPDLWLGNEELVDFTPLELDVRNQQRRRVQGLEWLRRAAPFGAVAGEPAASGRTTAGRTADGRTTDGRMSDGRATVQALQMKIDPDLMDIHRAALLAESSDPDLAIQAIRALEHLLGEEDELIRTSVLLILRRTAIHADPQVVRRAFQLLATVELPAFYRQTLLQFLSLPMDLLDPETTDLLVEHDLSPERLDAFIGEAEDHCNRSKESDASARSLLTFLSHYGSMHPGQYRRLRAFLTQMSLFTPKQEIKDHADSMATELERNFRAWVGPPSRVAVDPETLLEYRWDDVLAYSDEVGSEERQRLTGAFKNTPLLRETVFLFSAGTILRLEDILPSGVWIRQIGSHHGKSVYRVSVKTRRHEQFDFVVNLNHDQAPDQVQKEIDWIIVCSESQTRKPVVGSFGGYWPKYKLWTEEYFPGETLEHALRRLSRNQRHEERYLSIWPYAAWSAMSAFVDLWNRTGEADPQPDNVIVPLRDYHTGARVASISGCKPYSTIDTLLTALRRDFIDAVEREHPPLAGTAGWDIVFSAVLEVMGEDEGIALLRHCLSEPGAEITPGFQEALERYIPSVEQHGFLPRRLFFAVRRFRRWTDLNPEAAVHAAANTLQEVYDTYHLDDLKEQYPEARVRFFRNTIFREAPEPLAQGLEEIIDGLRRQLLVPDELSAAVADLRTRLKLHSDEDYFLARLSYPYLQPEDEATFISAEAGGSQQSEMVVTLEDDDGNPYHIRHALSAKEVARLHRLFLAARLDVQFRPEHRFLVAVNERGHLIGGLFYELREDTQSAHMDKVVVAGHFQRLGVAAALMEELCNRLKIAGYRSLTTGFFRPQFFYRLGFSVEKRYAGLVRTLD